jgi:hypothetical protein
MRLLAFFYLLITLLAATLLTTYPGARITVRAGWHAIDPTRVPVAYWLLLLPVIAGATLIAVVRVGRES